LKYVLERQQHEEAQFSLLFEQDGSIYHGEQCLLQERSITAKKKGSDENLVKYCSLRIDGLTGHSRIEEKEIS
jgi:hypothetical protein